MTSFPQIPMTLSDSPTARRSYGNVQQIMCRTSGFVCFFLFFFCSSLYIPSVPSIVIVIRLVVLGQLAEGKSLSSTHQRKQLKLSLQVNSLFFFFFWSP